MATPSGLSRFEVTTSCLRQLRRDYLQFENKILDVGYEGSKIILKDHSAFINKILVNYIKYLKSLPKTKDTPSPYEHLIDELRNMLHESSYYAKKDLSTKDGMAIYSETIKIIGDIKKEIKKKWDDEYKPPRNNGWDNFVISSLLDRYTRLPNIEREKIFCWGNYIKIFKIDRDDNSERRIYEVEYRTAEDKTVRYTLKPYELGIDENSLSCYVVG